MDRTNKSELSKEILEYYYKFGKNRNIEKFFQLHGSCYHKSKSSSEGSVNATSELNENAKNPINKSKSLDNLMLYENNQKVNYKMITEDDNKNEQIKIGISLSSNDHNLSKEIPQLSKQSVSTMTSDCVLEKEKNDKPKYSFSCESNISISLPMPFSTNSSTSINKPEKQSDVKTDDSNQSNNDEGKLNQSNCSSNDNELLKSPGTSTKLEKRLEWDSLGDVGYSKSPRRRRRRKSTITSLEKSILKEFFANQGIEVNFPIPEETESTSIIPNQHQSKSETKKDSEAMISSSREKWREVLNNIKTKYKDELINKQDANLEPNQSSFGKAVSENNHSTPREKTAEKLIQTSFVVPQFPSENKEIQVNITRKEFPDAISTLEGDNLISPSSFVYISQPSQLTHTESSDKENQVPQRSKQMTSPYKSKPAKCSTTSISTESSSNQDTSDVNLGVKLLCSLIEAKSLNNKQKKLLAKKIISKITKKKLSSASDKTTTTTASSNCILSRTSLISTSRQSAIKVTTSTDSDQVLKIESLSSSSMENNRINEINQKEKNLIVQKSTSEDQNDDNESTSENNKNPSRTTSNHKNEEIEINSNKIETVRKCVENKSSSLPNSSTDKRSLVNNWLGNLTKSEINYAQRKQMTEKQKIDLKAGGDSSSITTHKPHFIEYLELERINHINWIENEIKHLENLKKLLLTEKIGAESQEIIPSKPEITLAYPIYKKLDLQIYDKVASSDKNYLRPPNTVVGRATGKTIELHKIESETKMINPKEKYTRKVKRVTDNVVYDNVGASTLSGVRKDERDLQITMYTVNEEKRFPKKNYQIDNRDTIDDKNKEKSNRSRLKTPQSPIENDNNSRSKSKSSPSNHYSELHDEASSRKQSSKDYAYSNSVPSTSFSSRSISLPIVQTSTTTTTHGYDRHVGVGIQTSNSLLKTIPIFGKPKLDCGCEDICKCKRTQTIREFNSNNNKQAQVKPTAVAYIINFEEKKKEDSDDDCTSPKPHYTLQEYLHKKRPDFEERVAERQRILNEMKTLRKDRQKKIEEIIENASGSSVCRKLNQLPPPPTKRIRIFPTKEMKAMTNRHYRQLPEVIAKAERESKERKKRTTRVLSSVFNKRLQNRAHKGKLSLEHSRTVI